MLFYIILVVLFLTVFGFLTWRIILTQTSSTPPPDDSYICPDCNERHCECHKKDKSRQ